MKVTLLTAIVLLFVIPNALAGTAIRVPANQVANVTTNAGWYIEGSLPTSNDVCWFRGKNYDFYSGYPWTQTLMDSTYFCANHLGGVMTYRATTVGEYSPLCTDGEHYQYRIGGGMGQDYVEWDDVGHFTCPFPYLGINFIDQMAIYATSDGNYVMYWHT